MTGGETRQGLSTKGQDSFGRIKYELPSFLLLSGLLHLLLFLLRDSITLPREDLPTPALPIEVSLVAGAVQNTAQFANTPAKATEPPKAPDPPPEVKKPPQKPAPLPKPKPKPRPPDPELEPEPLRDREKPADTATPTPSSASNRQEALKTPAVEDKGAPGKATESKPAGAEFEGPKPASHMNNPKPEYPEVAKRRGWEGKVTLKVFVHADGTVGEVRVAVSSGHEMLDEAALDAVRRWRFVPAKRNGQAVDSWVSFPINWNIDKSR